MSEKHIIPPGVYLLVYVALGVLLALTVVVAQQDLGEWNPVAALGIAFAKAVLIVLFFMHVRYASRLTQLVSIAGFLWLAILLSFTMGDYLTRDWLTISGG